ncbi:hypothetical protein BOX15_Mlig014770g1, partial [Macrostomum lignano]
PCFGMEAASQRAGAEDGGRGNGGPWRGFSGVFAGFAGADSVAGAGWSEGGGLLHRLLGTQWVTTAAASKAAAAAYGGPGGNPGAATGSARPSIATSTLWRLRVSDDCGFWAVISNCERAFVGFGIALSIHS